MLRRFDLVVFDWDGTLIDSTATIARSIQAAAADLALPVPDFATASHVIGLGLRDALARAVPTLPADLAHEFSQRYRHHYFAAEDRLALFAGAQALIEALRAAGMPTAIATGKNTPGLQRALAATGMTALFDATRCADQTHPKPHPAMLLELADEFGVAPARVLMVGDTTHDLQMAAAARAEAVGVTYGAHPREQLAACQPMALVDSVAELRRWLLPH
ncbi:MAG: HAD family hydrolase [Burkholderiaceae bacterium]